VIALQQPVRLGVDAELGTPVEQLADAPEQRLVHPDGVGVRGQPWRDLRLQPLDLRRGVGRRQVEQHGERPVQQPSRPLERDDRVVERGGLPVGDDVAHLGGLLVEPCLDRRQEVLDGDPVERRQPEGQLARRGERVIGRQHQQFSIPSTVLSSQYLRPASRDDRRKSQ
jgi:hypothetical protein